MSSLTSALRIGVSGMQYSQLALGTISHNVVNANTTGFSRQIVQASAASTAGYGAGVQLDNIQRITDRFLVSRMLTASSGSAYAATKSSYMTSLENTFSTAGSGGGLESIVGGFVSSMNSLANDPSNSSLRRSTVEKAELTAQALNNTAADLQQVATNADTQMTSELDTVNQLLKDIYLLGRQISEVTTSSNGGNTNDLMDARDQKISQLSSTFGIQVSYDAENNGVRILTESGRKLVDSSGYVQLSRGTPDASGYQTIVSQNVRQDGSLAEAKLVINPADLTTGKIKALAEIRDQVVPDLMNQLNEFTETFAAALNKLSSQGTSYPPQASLTSANTYDLAAPTTDLLTNGFASLSGATLNISTTNTIGGVLTTTVGTPLTLTPVMPGGTLSLQDIADQINNNPSIGNAAMGGTAGVIATAATDMAGNTYLKIEAADPNARVVMANAGTTDVLGSLGMNNLFTGSTAATISVRSDISANPDRFPVARMNSVGGVSSTDGQNIVAMAQIGDTRLTFDAAGSLGTQTVTGVSYLNTISSNLAVSTSAARDNETFSLNLYTQSQEMVTSVSGVNLNEELAQMLVYQNSFQASSRIINVVNDLLQELINII